MVVVVSAVDTACIVEVEEEEEEEEDDGEVVVVIVGVWWVFERDAAVPCVDSDRCPTRVHRACHAVMVQRLVDDEGARLENTGTTPEPRGKKIKWRSVSVERRVPRALGKALLLCTESTGRREQ